MDVSLVVKKAFMGRSSLQAIEIPAGVEEIGTNCFKENTSLASVTFASGNGLTYIRKCAFCMDSCIQEIDIPENVEEIGEDWFKVFTYQSSLYRVTFRSGSKLRSIGNGRSVGAITCMRSKFLMKQSLKHESTNSTSLLHCIPFSRRFIIFQISVTTETAEY